MTDSRLVYDLTRIKAKAMSAFFKAANANDIEAMAEVFAQVIVACPPEWGDPAEAQTYLELPFYGAFQEALRGMVEAARSSAGNLSGQ